MFATKNTILKYHNIKLKQASGAAKTAALERSVRFREGKLEVAKWHLQKVTLELRMLKDELKHVEKLPVQNFCTKIT
jgi:hypothetical protein